MTIYPSAADRHLVQRLAATPDHGSPKRWVLRDDNHQHYHGRVDAGAGAVVIELSIKAHRGDTPEFVGCYRLDLRALLAAGVVRPDPAGSRGRRVRVRFRREDDGTIYLQVRGGMPRIPVGEMPRRA